MGLTFVRSSTSHVTPSPMHQLKSVLADGECPKLNYGGSRIGLSRTGQHRDVANPLGVSLMTLAGLPLSQLARLTSTG
jgi:hypothetical protein